MTRNFNFLMLLLLLLLVAIFTASVSGQYLIASINCGASKIITDKNSITWSPDDTLVSNGQVRTVVYSESPVMDSLRVFTTRKKNCYAIGQKLQGVKVLVRASFNYGNYDRLSTPPKFNLHFDGNHWDTIFTSSIGLIWYEVTYIATRDHISVCLAQTIPGQYPFISALEVRKLDPEVYSEVDKNRALFLIRRDSYGASESTRYPADKYDRIWQPPLSTLDVLTNMAFDVDTTEEPNNPPSEVFQHAVTVESMTNSLYVGTVYPSYPSVYANIYFSEVTYLGSIYTRSFRAYASSSLVSRWLSNPISPPYGGVLKLNYKNYTADSTENVYLASTADSDYPPIINAFESFYISDVLTDGTDSKDVASLALLQSTFKVLAGWSGDPCLPSPFSWDWIGCSDDVTPRVTSLDLNGFDLSGSLPDISSMDALKIIDLHNNSLTGTIPSFLGNMPNLQQLNLANNKFTGSIPISLSSNNRLTLTVTGNPLCASGKSCSSPPGDATSLPRKKKSSKLPLILGIVFTVFVLFWVAAGVYIITRRRTNLANNNMPVVTGRGANENVDVGSNMNSNVVEMNGTPEDVTQQPFGSSSAPATSTTT